MNTELSHKKAFALLIIIQIILLGAVSNANAAADALILSDTGYIDSEGYYHVVGELKNTGDEPIGFVRVGVTFYDSEENVIDAIFDLTMLDTIMIGQKSPFDIILYDSVKSEQVARYSVDVEFSPTEPKPQNLEISEHTAFRDENGLYHIVGNITNNGEETALNVKLIATFYNESGDVVAARLSYIDPEITSLGSGETAEFDVVLDDEERSLLVSSYEITSESLQYSIVPEFSVITMLLILVFLTAFLLLTTSIRGRRFIFRSKATEAKIQKKLGLENSRFGVLYRI